MKNLNDNQLIHLLELRMVNLPIKQPKFKTAKVVHKFIKNNEFIVTFILTYEKWADEEKNVDFSRLYLNEYEYIKRCYREIHLKVNKQLDGDDFGYTLSDWVSLDDKLPNEGLEVLLFNIKWVDEDFNPKGIRIGFLNGTGEWITAYYCNQHDEYHTRDSENNDDNYKQNLAEDQIPTHWFEIPNTINLK